MRYVEILRKLSDAGGQRRGTTDPMLEKVINTLTMFPERALPLERMAEELHMSKYYFIRKFRENVGLPPHQFHLQRRIRKAQKRLRAKCSIVDVALKHFLTSADSGGAFSYHLVRIAPGGAKSGSMCMRNSWKRMK